MCVCVSFYGRLFVARLLSVLFYFRTFSPFVHTVNGLRSRTPNVLCVSMVVSVVISIQWFSLAMALAHGPEVRRTETIAPK